MVNPSLQNAAWTIHPASFRDPSGFVFLKQNILYRHINVSYRSHFNQASESGLWKELIDQGFLISHEEIDPAEIPNSQAFKIIKPSRIPFISYPYEWSFSQLKAAALLTLEIQKKALLKGMSLKDASSYNIQFLSHKPILIDTLSFETYIPGSPWIAYRQFCRHFLAPLALMARKDSRLHSLLQVYPDGIPLDMAAGLLPVSDWFGALGLHLHLQAKIMRHNLNRQDKKASSRMSLSALLNLIGHLQSTVEKLTSKKQFTAWQHYQKNKSYTREANISKEELVTGFLKDCPPGMVWDLGANDGFFSNLAAKYHPLVISFEQDPTAAENHYKNLVAKNEGRVLPLITDLTAPSPAIGWQNKERESLIGRGPASIVLALGLIHHLRITAGIPYFQLAAFFSEICSRDLLAEFIPKTDPRAKEMLRLRQDIFDDYHSSGFEKAFGSHFDIIKKETVKNSERVLYFLRKK